MCFRWSGLISAILAVVLLVGGAAYAAPNILVVGDSLSAAYGLPQNAGWVSLLKSRLVQEKFPHQVENASISGETTSGGRTRIDALLKEYKPKIVILELGANDGLRGLSVQQTRANLEAIILACKRSRAQVLLVGMRLPPNYGPAYTEPFHALFGELARKHKLRHVPFLFDAIAGKREYFQADGLHPTAQAQPLLLDTVWRELRGMLKANN
jgi:acyl-CoA thioesterase-1